MKGFLVKLSDEHRVTLEAYRACNGLRSLSDALRQMIEREEARLRPLTLDTKLVGAWFNEGAEPVGDPHQVFTDGHGKPKPAPKPKPFKSRLKGEWKAP